jgi:hypothetical protein
MSGHGTENYGEVGNKKEKERLEKLKLRDK